MITVQSLLGWLVAILLAVGSLGIYLGIRYPAPAVPAHLVVNTVTCTDATKSCGYI